MEKKNNNIIIALIAVIVVIGGVVAFVALSGDGGGSLGLVKSEYTIRLYKDGSQAKSISSEVNKLRTNPYLKDEVDNDTVKWIESFNNNEYIYVSGAGNYHLIMKRSDYDTLKSQIDTSELDRFKEHIEATIKANMIETRSLGGGYKDIVYVNNVELTNTVKIQK